MPSAIVIAHPQAVCQMSANHGEPGALHNVADTPMPIPRKLSRKDPTTSPRMIDLVVGCGGRTSSLAPLSSVAVSVIASDMLSPFMSPLSGGPAVASPLFVT